MADEQHDPAINALRNQVEEVQKQLAQIDKDNTKGLDLLKWGMGSFATLAIVAATFNWVSAKSNYDKDRDSLRQDLALLEEKLSIAEKELSAANFSQETDIHSQVESNITKLNEAHAKEIAAIRTEADSNIVQIVAQRKAEILEAFTKFTNYTSTLSNAIQSQLDDSRNRTIGALHHFHPVLAMFDRHKALSVSVMRVESHVSDSVSGSAFFPAADMPNWHHARWKIDFFAIDGVASSRTISPLRGAI